MLNNALFLLFNLTVNIVIVVLAYKTHEKHFNIIFQVLK